jgi:hypothetical protein
MFVLSQFRTRGDERMLSQVSAKHIRDLVYHRLICGGVLLASVSGRQLGIDECACFFFCLIDSVAPSSVRSVKCFSHPIMRRDSVDSGDEGRRAAGIVVDGGVRGVRCKWMTLALCKVLFDGFKDMPDAQADTGLRPYFGILRSDTVTQAGSKPVQG